MIGFYVTITGNLNMRICIMIYKNHCITIVCIISLFILSACTSNAIKKEAPMITINYGDKDIKYNLVSYDADDTIENSVFIIDLDKFHDEDIPYIKIGEKINIDFNGKFPDTCKLNDYILNPDGSKKYNDPPIQIIPIEIFEYNSSFILEKNWPVSFSSNLKDYEKGAIIRGFRLVCSQEDSIYEYRFVIRTDG